MAWEGARVEGRPGDARQEKFAASYRAAGGEHLWVDKPGPMTDKAHEMVKSFIARYLRTVRRAA
jgi:hypothetical protein